MGCGVSTVVDHKDRESRVLVGMPAAVHMHVHTYINGTKRQEMEHAQAQREELMAQKND
jgi:hypothetical protein